MREHSRVANFQRLPVENEFVYRIARKDDLRPLKVFLSDAYWFGLPEYLARPKEIEWGDFILVARPEANFDSSLWARNPKDGIGIGKLAHFMGALNAKYPQYYQYHGDE